MARLDRLGPALGGPQIRSVILLRIFLFVVAPRCWTQDAGFGAALEKLAEADIVLVQGLPPGSDYRFKHGADPGCGIREPPLKSRRGRFCIGASPSLAYCFADTTAAEPEALAHHFTQAGMTDDAIDWWGKAVTRHCAALHSKKQSRILVKL